MPKYCEKYKKGSLEMLFLKLLSEGDFYGYELAKLFNHLSDNVITLSAGNMYPTLYKLEEKGYIRSYEKTVGKRMKRVYYHLTDEGRKELQVNAGRLQTCCQCHQCDTELSQGRIKGDDSIGKVNE